MKRLIGFICIITLLITSIISMNNVYVQGRTANQTEALDELHYSTTRDMCIR